MQAAGDEKIIAAGCTRLTGFDVGASPVLAQSLGGRGGPPLPANGVNLSKDVASLPILSTKGASYESLWQSDARKGGATP